MIGWRILCAGLVLVAVATAAAAGLAQLAGKLSVPSAWLALLIGIVAAWLAARHASAPKQRTSVADIVLFAVMALAAARAFLWVIFPRGDDLCVLSPHNLGDMALHLNLINRWAGGGSFWPANPFLADAPFAYHAGMDLWNALLARIGVPVFEGLRWCGLLGAAAAAAALWRWGRGFALAAFLFAGGLGAWTVWTTGQLDGMQTSTAWKNLFLSMFVTQRGLLYALPATMVLLTVWRAQLSGADGPRLAMPAQAALYAAMPFFHAPAFLFLSVMLAALTLAGWKNHRAAPFLKVGLLAFIPATWLVHMVTNGFASKGAWRFDPGWMQNGDGWTFWLWNFGIFLPMLGLLGAILFRRGGANRTDRVIYAVGAGTILFCFLFLIAPWPWDNTKLLIWGYLAVAPLLWTHLLAPSPLWLRALLCTALFASGALALLGGLDARHGYKLASRSELAHTGFLLRSLGPNTRVACAPSYEHPALLLGQPVVMGYDGHLFSQGLDYHAVRRSLDRMMSGGPGWENAARSLQVRHLLWGRRESELWPRSTQPWQACATVIATSGDQTLYDITPCLVKD